jgi:ATP-dependent Clp protease ATP-binding subunit ClpA
LLVGVLLTEGSIGHEVLRELGLQADTALPHLGNLTLALAHPPEHVNHDAALDLALELAVDEALWLGHHYVGTEHLLLGITRTNLGNASDLLRLLNVSPEQVRRRVRREVKTGVREFTPEAVRRHARFSELSRRVLNAADELSISMDHQTIGIGHLMLALVSERRGQTTNLLLESGLDVGRVQRDLERQDAALLVSIEPLLNQALEISEQYSSHYTGTDHLLLALTTDAAAIALLRAYGANAETLAHAIDQQVKNQR